MSNLLISEIECIDNRRMTGIDELAANIAAVGLIQPIALTVTENGRWRVVAGRRRFRALQLLGWEALTEAQYVVCAADPELAAFCENFHRANLTLAEEVEQFKCLKTDNLTLQELAALLGKTVGYVALRLNLANLSKSWKNVLDNPEEYPQWTPAKLEIIAKQPAEVQEKHRYFITRTMTTKELNDNLARDYMALKTAPFDTSGCAECLKRSGAAELLFPELSDRGDTCLDRTCFEKKLLKTVLAEIAAIKKRLAADPDAEPFYLFRESMPEYGTEAYKAFNNVDSDCNFTREKNGKKKYNAYCVWGKRAGVYCRVKPIGSWIKPLNPKKANGSDAGEVSGKKVKTLADREQELLAKRTKLAIEAMNGILKNRELSYDRVKAANPEQYREVILALGYLFGIASKDGYCSNISKGFADSRAELAGDSDAFIKHCWRSVAGSIQTRLSQELNFTLDRIIGKNARSFCEILRWDYEELFFNPAAEKIQPGPTLLAARKAAESEKQTKGKK